MHGGEAPPHRTAPSSPTQCRVTLAHRGATSSVSGPQGTDASAGQARARPGASNGDGARAPGLA